MPGHQSHDSAFVFSPGIIRGEDADLPRKPFEILTDGALLGRLLGIIDEGGDNGTGNTGGVEYLMAVVGRARDENMRENVSNARAGGISGAERVISVVLMKDCGGCIPREKFSLDVIGQVHGVMVDVAVSTRAVARVGSESLGEGDGSGRTHERLPAKDGVEEALEVNGIVDGAAKLPRRGTASLRGGGLWSRLRDRGGCRPVR